ncbi:peptidoglycan D,D-transpeptidase FtsI family protein [Acidihalobacter prosperus]|uniref:Peptidoglycan D,D-transpeptidase FtsI n=1 Tax=Acidihalobacter prosperus TaxID=160660 RepID=A0A1A6C3E3_9GAMM|nr:penicillin-binding protein 2 [Acidihalobacter prosperus]OBS09079.1 cell division protein [Acidihalobacter prosperus]
MNSRPDFKRRRQLVLGLFGVGAAGLVGRGFDLEVMRGAFLRKQGDARYLRVVKMPAHRGMILDRNGRPLAISTPMDSVWIDPQQDSDAKGVTRLARLLGLDAGALDEQVVRARQAGREFLWVRRLIDPELAHRVAALKVPGVGLLREYKRFYPMGEVGSHVLGFTNIDDQGQDGLELEFNTWLTGKPGAKRVIKNGFGQIVQNVDQIRSPRPGRDLVTSIDQRIQYLAYRSLKAAVVAHGARSGSIVVMDPNTGAIVAMADQPTFNPNVRSDYVPRLYRNRAVTDAYEPGSTMKPFTLSAALLSGKYTPDTEINTSPGWYMLAGHTIKDDSDFGRINLTQVLQVSSNVAASKISLSLPPYYVWSMYRDFGFGQITHSGFPGESPGTLHNYTTWRPIDQATMAYGYGIAVTSLQLAHAYCALANGGVMAPATFVQPTAPVTGKRVLPQHVADQMRTMLRSVVTPMGTGYAAHIPGYTVAGKTGTAHRLTNKGDYAEDKYTAVFAGIVPATRPRLVAVIMIDDPTGGKYYGGQVAAPVFKEVMSGALRLLDIPPDDIDVLQAGPVPQARGAVA